MTNWNDLWMWVGEEVVSRLIALILSLTEYEIGNDHLTNGPTNRRKWMKKGKLHVQYKDICL